MNALEIIIKKREGLELSPAEIEFFIRGFTRDEIPDYQASAWAMAILLNGMTDREVTDLTLSMAHSGEVLEMGKSGHLRVDKHSTGGVGDKTSLVVLPTVVSCGLPVGKMSGRGLGFSGGTLDKLESIPGYRTDLSPSEFKRQMDRIGIVLTGQSHDLAPADGKLYALRDVTGTVPSIPLIASSIMSKKIAAGSQALVLDVKTGTGAFMQSLDEARKLSRLMIAIGRKTGMKVVCLLSDMNQPLGNAIGNSLEVVEALKTLMGGGPSDFREHCLVVSAQMLVLGGVAGSQKAGRRLAEKALQDGSALAKFREMVQAQGGDAAYVDDPGKFRTARYHHVIRAERSGHIAEVQARSLGEASVLLGAGRTRKEDQIDHSAGILVYKKVGEVVKAGDALYALFANHKGKLDEAKLYLRNAVRIVNHSVSALPLFYK